MVRGDRSAVGCAAIAAIIMMAVTFALAPPARAQAHRDSPIPDAGCAEPPPAADPPADAPIEGIEPIAAADAGSGSDDAAEEHSGWVRSGDDDDSDNQNSPSKVLEVPQVVDPANAQPDPGQAAGDDDSSSQDQVGSIGEYQSEDDTDVAVGAIGPLPPGVLNPYGPGTIPANSAPLNHASGPAYVPAFRANIGRPGAGGLNAAIGPTSPMFPSHNFTSIRGGFRGGWWHH